MVAVYPSAGAIPDNVLRFYVAFSHPMREGDFLDHVRLQRTDTKEDLTGVFFDNLHELWSSDRRRITLLVDPGRVKTGLRANRERGRAFVAGARYRLTVLDSWRTTLGEPLSGAYEHDFEAIDADHRAVDPARWCMDVPRAGTLDPLRVDFGEAVDHTSVHHLLTVLDPAGTPLRGAWTLGAEERRARWSPVQPWAEPVSGHALRVVGRFEDIAGNNVNAEFEHRVGAIEGGRESTPRLRRIGEPCAVR